MRHSIRQTWYPRTFLLSNWNKHSVAGNRLEERIRVRGSRQRGFLPRGPSALLQAHQLPVIHSPTKYVRFPQATKPVFRGARIFASIVQKKKTWSASRNKETEQQGPRQADSEEGARNWAAEGQDGSKTDLTPINDLNRNGLRRT